jgi:hypothetical protein
LRARLVAEVEFYGETFTLAGEFSEFALMEFAEAAEMGAEGGMSSMAAMLRLVLDCIAPGADSPEHAKARADAIANGDPDPGDQQPEHKRFRQLARKNRAKAEQLMDVLKAAMEAAAERPTGQPADSSTGPASIEAKSGNDAVDRVVRAFPGRPDIQAGILDIQGAETG